MFTGIVTELGEIVTATPVGGSRRISVLAPTTSAALIVGDSVAVNGVCLTAIAVDQPRFAVDVVPESLDRTTLGDLAAGDAVDLERPLLANGRFDGHIVQGHVDGVGVVSSVTRGQDGHRMRITAPSSLGRYVVEKGSITVDGVSLTIASVAVGAALEFEIALIPHTAEMTVLGLRAAGERVNLEVDVVAKYVERLMEARG